MEITLPTPPSVEKMQFDNYREPSAQSAYSREADTTADQPKKLRRSLIPWLLLLLIMAGAALVAFELHTANYSAKPISDYAKTLTYQLKSGASSNIVYPQAGPFDER